jgi:hypothetical protein
MGLWTIGLLHEGRCISDARLDPDSGEKVDPRIAYGISEREADALVILVAAFHAATSTAINAALYAISDQAGEPLANSINLTFSDRSETAPLYAFFADQFVHATSCIEMEALTRTPKSTAVRG